LTSVSSLSNLSSLVGLSHHKSAPENVAAAREALLSLKGPAPSDKVKEHVAKYLSRVKVHLLGSDGTPPTGGQEIEVVHSIVRDNTPPLLSLLVQKLPNLEFEARKDAVQIFNGVLHSYRSELQDGVEYVHKYPELLTEIASGYTNIEIALNCGAMLRECIKHEKLARDLLFSPIFLQFFQWVELKEFEAASDAFTTFKEILTTHKAVVAEYIEAHYDEFFEHYTLLLKSANYVTRRLSLKLLSEILLDRTNGAVMTRYIKDLENLKLMMLLLKDQSKNIQYEAFHVFKVFVANPNKPPDIIEMLKHNKSKMLRYLGNFHNDREDEQFKQEKAVLCHVLQELPE